MSDSNAPECEERVIAKLPDSCRFAIMIPGLAQLIRARRDLGRAKYKCTMDRTDLTIKEWLRHALEEALDLAIYLERCAEDDDNDAAIQWEIEQGAALELALALYARIQELEK